MEAPPLLLAVGAGKVSSSDSRVLGPISDDALLAQAYAAADVLAVPTVADAINQTAIESIACGTPCVSFDQGGITDVVRPGETGYRARFGDITDFARGLRSVLDATDSFRERCRHVAEEEYSADLQVRRYVGVYERVLDGP